MSFPQILQDARRARGLSQRDLASQVGVGQAHIALIEGGGRRPSTDLLEALCRVLDIDPREALAAVARPPVATADTVEAGAGIILTRELVASSSEEAA